ncbi:MAG TPA: hypothetical protein VIE63_16515, partial [Ramlibacter sp.]
RSRAMNDPKKKKEPSPPAPPVQRSPDTLPPYDAFEPIPQPEVSEKNTDTMWATWHELNEKADKHYADTVPVTKPGEVSSVPSMRTNSQPPGAVQVRRAPSAGASGLEKLIEESRRNNRVCPMPTKWRELDAMLRGAAPPPKSPADVLPPMLPATEWKTTTSLAKRLMFRNVIDWAGGHGMVETALQFVRALPEEQWHHMGD